MQPRMNKTVAQPTSPRDPERIVLGSCLCLDAGEIETLGAIIQPGDFQVGAHQHIFEFFLRLARAGEPVDDPAYMADRISEAWDTIECPGGDTLGAYLAASTDCVISRANAPYHARRVRERALRRRAKVVGLEIAETALSIESVETARVMSEKAEEIAKGTEEHRTATPLESAQATWDFTQNAVDGHETGVLSGLPLLDDIINGFRPGDLAVLAARPSLGKTALALQIALREMEHDGTVLIVSLEMAKEQILERLAAQSLWLPLTNMTHHRLNDAEMQQFFRFLNRVRDELPCWIYDDMRCGPETIWKEAQNLQLRTGDLRLVIVDYIQLIDLPGKPRGMSREQEVASISRGLKRMARDLAVPVLAISQLNRSIEHEKRPPRLSDLRESGAIEQDADVVIFISQQIKPETTNGWKGQSTIHVAKQRQGPLGQVAVVFDASHTVFRPMAKQATEKEDHAGPRT